MAAPAAWRAKSRFNIHYRRQTGNELRGRTGNQFPGEVARLMIARRRTRGDITNQKREIIKGSFAHYLLHALGVQALTSVIRLTPHVLAGSCRVSVNSRVGVKVHCSRARSGMRHIRTYQFEKFVCHFLREVRLTQPSDFLCVVDEFKCI